MSEEVILNGHKEAEEPKELVLTIRQTADGKISIEAPSQGKFFNIPLCLYLLDVAHDHIKMHNARSAAQENPVITKAGRYKGLWPK